MKLDKVIVLLNYKGKRDYLIFNSRRECDKYFQNKENLDKIQDLQSFEIYYAKFCGRG